MLTLAWVLITLAGLAAVLLLFVVWGLLRFLFGSSRRRAPVAAARVRRVRPVAWILRTIFVVWVLTLLAAHTVASPGLRVGSALGCSTIGARVECAGYPGARLVGDWLSLPARLGDYANILLVVARDPGRYLGDGLASLPLPPGDLALGLAGPLVLLLALAGFASLLRLAGRLWRGA